MTSTFMKRLALGAAAFILLAGGFWFYGRHIYVGAFVKLRLTREKFPEAFLVPQPMALASPRGEPLAWGSVRLLSPWGAPVGQKGGDKAVKLDFLGGRSLVLMAPSTDGEYTLAGIEPSKRAAVQHLMGPDITGYGFYRKVLETTPDQVPWLGGPRETVAPAVICLLKTIGMMGKPVSIHSFETPQARGFVYRIPSKQMVRVAAFDSKGVFQDVMILGEQPADEEVGALISSLSFQDP